jgi:hypothetical protein
VRGPNYPLIDERPTFDQDLESRLIEKPAPQIQSLVTKPIVITVEVTTDESGNIVYAWCVGDFAFSGLGRSAEHAAYNARVAPKANAGKRVRSRGLIRYSVSPG